MHNSRLGALVKTNDGLLRLFQLIFLGTPICAIVALSLQMAGCAPQRPPSDATKSEFLRLDNRNIGEMELHRWTEFNHDGHRYVWMGGPRYGSLLHHPDCPCLKKAEAEEP